MLKTRTVPAVCVYQSWKAEVTRIASHQPVLSLVAQHWTIRSGAWKIELKEDVILHPTLIAPSSKALSCAAAQVNE